MKKILLIIFLLSCFVNVYANERTFAGSEYLEGISYMKNNYDIQQYRNAQVIRDVVTGEIAYCIEPFKLLKNNSSDYVEINNYDSKFGIPKDRLEKIKLYSYYGYGYKNHTDKKWISITQLSIWRTIFPEYQFDWIDNTTSRNIITPFNNELNELNNLVDNHFVYPNLNNNYILGINNKTVLYDSNNVLENYEIKESDFDAKIINNTLEISTGKDEKKGKIVLQRAIDKFNDSVKYFYSSLSQNVMERGNIEPVNFEINIEVKEGNIIVNKIDSETNDKISQGEGDLNGSIFELFNEKMEKINELIIEDNTLTFDNLSFGKYYIKEKKPGTGYYLNKDVYEVIIDENNLEQEINISNQVIKSKVKIIKFFGTKSEYENNTMKREKNAMFIIYDNNKNVVFSGVTDENGIIETKLPYGKYVLSQITSATGYSKVDNYEFTINEENSISYDIVLNDFKINVPNANINYFRYLITSILEKLYV